MTKQSLIAEWKNARPEYKFFCEDGILVPEIWDDASPKILFLLKETYDTFIDISGELGPNGGSAMFFRKLKMRTYIITELANKRIPTYEGCLAVKEQPNDSIAYVNIKKNVDHIDNEWQSTYADIMEYAISDKDFLKKQINLINPDIIFCCATIEFLLEIYPEIQEISDRVYRLGTIIIISYSHPSSRTGYEKEFQDLTSILKDEFQS